MLPRFLVIPVLLFAGVVALVVATPDCAARGAVVKVTSSSAIDRALRVAKAKGAGTTVYFKAGAYQHGHMEWPDGINLRGDGIGRTRLDFVIRFGSRSHIGGRSESTGLTIGSSEAKAFDLRDGSQRTSFRWVRFRGRGSELWDICDFTHYWRDRVVKSDANAHHIVWTDCEFEYTGNSSATTFNVWWDARSGGGNVYNLTWKRCTFGVKNSNGQFGSGRMGILIQPSPPEHASDGPRPGTKSDPGGITSTDFGFDCAQVTHGSGQAAISGASGYGFRIWDSAFVGPASLASFDLCDYIRAWAMVTYKLKSPNEVTSAMRAAAPHRMTTKGVDLRRVWMAGEFISEYGRSVTTSAVSESQGASTYHVRAVVLRHDKQLYGF